MSEAWLGKKLRSSLKYTRFLFNAYVGFLNQPAITDNICVNLIR